MFGVGSDDAMFHRAVVTASWPPPPEGWGPLGGIFTSPSAAISFGPEGAEKWAIVGLGTDNQPYLKIFDFAGNGVWLPSASDWLPLGGVLIYEPAVPNRSQDESTSFDIFGVGEDRQMYHMIVDGAQWPPKTSGWQPVGGCFRSPPAVVKWDPGRVDVFGLGMDHAKYHRASENGNWLSDWEFRGGVFDSSPEVVSWGANRLDIFGLGTDDQMYHKAWTGNAWLPSPTGWDPLGGVFTSAPTACSAGFSTLHIFGLGTDFQMYHKFWNGSQWLPSHTDWEPLGGVFTVPRPTLLPRQLDFDSEIVFPDGVPVGGNVHVTLFRDGTSVFSGHFHDSGAVGFQCAIACGIADAAGNVYTFSESGPVAGTFEVGSRDFSWNDQAPVNQEIRDHWEDLFACGGTRFRFMAQVNVNVASLWPLSCRDSAKSSA